MNWFFIGIWFTLIILPFFNHSWPLLNCLGGKWEQKRVKCILVLLLHDNSILEVFEKKLTYNISNVSSKISEYKMWTYANQRFYRNSNHSNGHWVSHTPCTWSHLSNTRCQRVCVWPANLDVLPTSPTNPRNIIQGVIVLTKESMAIHMLIGDPNLKCYIGV